MTSPIEKISVKCPECGKKFRDWRRRSINLAVDDYPEAYVKAASSSVCPYCNHEIKHNIMIIGDRGICWSRY